MPNTAATAATAATPVAQAFTTFAGFYPLYPGEHRNPTCRRLHFLGSTLVLVCLAMLDRRDSVLNPLCIGADTHRA